jgi:hypothetical protein
MKRLLLIAILVTGAWSSGIYDNAGTKFFPFLKREYDARAIAMAGVSVAMENRLYGVLSNPASLGYIDRMEAMISYTPVVLDINGLTIAFGMPYKNYGVFAANIVYMSYGSFEPRDESGNSIEGSLHPYSIAGSVSWSRIMMENLSVGLTVKGIYERLSEGIEDEINQCSADGFGIDIGAQYRTKSSRLIYGLLIKNLGFIRSSYSEDTGKTGLPLSFAIGLSYIFRNFPTVKTAFDIEKAVDDYLHYKLGLELNVYRQIFFIRGGFNFSQSDAEEFFALIKNGSFNKEYQKSNWTLCSVGIGIQKETQDVDITLDAALRFRVDRAAPSFAFTLMFGL